MRYLNCPLSVKSLMIPYITKYMSLNIFSCEVKKRNEYMMLGGGAGGVGRIESNLVP